MRMDKSDSKAVAFADQEGTEYLRRSRDDRLHIPRLPIIKRPGRVWELSGGAALLHLGFVDLPRARLKNLVYNLFDMVTGSRKSRAEMTQGLADQGLTSSAKVSLGELPPPWLELLTDCGTLKAAADLSLRDGGWRAQQVLSWLSDGMGPGRFTGITALEFASDIKFPSFDPEETGRTVRMLRRLARDTSWQ
mmetsp:Transcript_85565/g.228149  ORF Transcript_85565/g.228149 Transcript_85565/m.228149 type:complete len:192 (+) Transcript_85565:547-1122(+)